MQRLLVLVVALLLAFVHAKDCAKATYRVTLTTLFNKDNFPDIADFPADPHLSPLVTFSHNRRFSGFVLYGYSTPGVKDVAELGATGKLQSELMHPLVKDTAVAKGLVGATGSFELDLELDCDAPFISAITMVAPSPDWILAISGLDMRDEAGMFVPLREGELKVYDAGTDSGETFESADLETDPPENIAPINDAPFFGKPAGTYKIELIAGGDEMKPCKKGPKGKKCRQRRRKMMKKEMKM